MPRVFAVPQVASGCLIRAMVGEGAVPLPGAAAPDKAKLNERTQELVG